MRLEHVVFEGKKVPVVAHEAVRANCSHNADPVPAVPTDPFIRWVLAQAGVDAASYQHLCLARRLQPSLRSIRVRSQDEAYALLSEHCDLVPSVVSSLIIGVTEFFRDPSVFEMIRRDVLPALARDRRPLRVWSAGCSSGAELYSLAMLMAEDGLLGEAELLGTDLRGDAVEQARAGIFEAADIHHVDPLLRDRYFESVNGKWRVVETLRRAVSWRVSDLVREQPPGTWDIILYRNLAIYFAPSVTAELWTRLAGSLSPGGCLVVGKAERPPASSNLASLGRCIYRRNG